MRALALLLLCVFGSTLVSLTVANNGSGPDSCCFRYYERQVKFTKIRSYDLTDGRCSKPAVILQTIRNVRICVDPEAAWVKSAMTRLDERNF
ncbi:C-C motif chemokine 36.1 [Gadus morhua]|uniref:Chemokine interleukin-8-like domain-containing protein n=1 Tax=Gadus morhua TaxID=8049 RepID=A0A8C5B9X0_GADMO|nr:monocyte chemotactic protein 1B-like [Gadus morhua]